MRNRKWIFLICLLMAAGGCQTLEEWIAGAEPNSIAQIGEAATAAGTAIVPFNSAIGLIIVAAGGLIIAFAAFLKRIKSK